MLAISGLRAGYGRIEVLRGIDLAVADREIVTIIGANGAGKSTLLRAISGTVGNRSGAMDFAGNDLLRMSVEAIASAGVVQVPEGRQLFGPLSVEENLQLGSYTRRGRRGRPAGEKMKEVFALFPLLEERRAQQAGTLSGGEQQMLAIGRALMAEPRLLLLDEPSMGLAPLIVREIFRTLRRLNEAGLAMLLVEQDARIALSLAHRGLVMVRGQVMLEDSAEGLLGNPEVQAIYFGRHAGRGVSGTEGG